MLGWPRMRLQHKSRCARRLRTPLAMCLGLAVSLTVAFAQEKPTLGAQSSGLSVDKPAHFQIWRTITLGTYRVLMLIAMHWTQRELNLAFLPTKSSAGPRFLMQK